MSDWVKIFNSLPAHPKVLRAGDRAAWLYVCGLCYANEHLTDGFIPREVLPVAAPGVKAPERLAAKLVEVGLWHLVGGGWQVHDYDEHQRTSSQVKETRRKDRERKARKEFSGTVPTDSARNPDGIPSASVGERERIPSETCADARSQEKRREEEKEEREGSAGAPESIEQVLAVLAEAPRLHLDRVGIENAVRAWPNGDPIRAARTVVTWVTDPAFRGTNAARLLISALEKQRPAPKGEVHSFRPRRQGQPSAEDFMRIARGEA